MRNCVVFGLSVLMLSCSGSKEMSIQVGNDAPNSVVMPPLDGTRFNEYQLRRTLDALNLEDAEVDLDVIWFSSVLENSTLKTQMKKGMFTLQHLISLLETTQLH